MSDKNRRHFPSAIALKAARRKEDITNMLMLFVKKTSFVMRIDKKKKFCSKGVSGP